MKLLNQSDRRYLLAARAASRRSIGQELRSGGWQRLEGNADVEVKLLKRRRCITFWPSSGDSVRRSGRFAAAKGAGAEALQKLQHGITSGRLKQRDKIPSALVGPKVASNSPTLCDDHGRQGQAPQLSWTWDLRNCAA